MFQTLFTRRALEMHVKSTWGSGEVERYLDTEALKVLWLADSIFILLLFTHVPVIQSKDICY